jgi:hypothetical protein
MPMERKQWCGRITALAVLCAVLGASCATQRGAPGKPETTQFQYRSGDDLDETFGRMGASSGQFTPKPGTALSDEPVYLSKKPQYCGLKLGDGDYTLVFDESRGTGTGIDTAYVDADGNGDFKENVKLAAAVEESSKSAFFDIAEVQVAYGEETYPYHVKLRRCNPSPNHIHVYSAACCEGEIAVGGKTYKAALLDGDGNGLFSDVYAPYEGRERRGNVYARGDSLLIDLNGDGEMKQSPVGGFEEFPLSKYLSVDGECYKLTVAPHGRSVTLAACEAACGFLVPPKGRTVSVLLGEEGAITVHGGGKAKAPADTYHMAHCGTEAKDAEGRVWRVTGRGLWEQPAIEVKPGEKTELAYGAPFVAEVTVDKRSSSEYRFGLKITGQAGEAYTARDFRPVDSKESPPAPTLNIIDEKGETVASGSFRYG